MATKNIIYKICSYITSCLHGKAELQVGERVRITLQPKNPLWPASLLATAIAVEATYGGRIYTFEFDDADLNGGPLFQGCDVISVSPYCCCEEIQDHVIAEAGEGGTATIHNFDGSTVCVVACPPDDLPEGYIPSIGPDGEILWGPPSSTTYTLSGENQPFERIIHLIGSDGTDSPVSIPELHDGLPTPGTYAPDANSQVTIPVTKTDFSTGGVSQLVGNLVIDLSELAGQQVSSFAYNSATNTYQITLDNGTVLSAPGTSVDTSVPGQVTITGPDGATITLPTQDVFLSGVSMIENPPTYVFTMSNGSVYQLPATHVNNNPLLGTVTITDPVGNFVTLSLQDVHVSGYAYAAPTGYTITLTDGATFSVPATTVDTSVAGQVTITGPDGNTATVMLNGDGSGVGSLQLVPDLSDPCSSWVVLTTNSGTIHEVGPLGNPNTVVLDPASTEHTAAANAVFNGYGLAGENPTANAGLHLPPDGSESRGTGPDFIKTVSSKAGCEVVTELKSGRRVGWTVITDWGYYSDTPRYEREDHPFFDATQVPAPVKNAAEVWRCHGGATSSIVLNSGGRVALNLSELHAIEDLVLSDGGSYRMTGCPDFRRMSLDGVNFIGWLGHAITNNDSNFYVSISDSQVDLRLGRITSQSGHVGLIGRIEGTSGIIDFDTILSGGGTGMPLYITESSGLRLRGLKVASDMTVAAKAIDIYRSQLTLEVEEVDGGWQGIQCWESTGVRLLGRRVRTNYWANFVGNAAIFVSGDRLPHADDSCTIQFDQVVRGGQFDGWVLYLFDHVKVRAYHTLFVHEYLGSGVNHAVFCSAKNSVPVTNVLSLYDCAAKVADPNMAIFQVNNTTTEVHVHGTFKSNSNVLEDVPSGFLFIMTGTIELGEPVA